MFSSIYSGRLITKTGRYKIFPIVGTATIAVGLYLLSTMGVGTSRIASSLYMVILGLGIGMIIQVMVLAVQNAVPHADLGTATATESFMRSMGGAFGVAVFGAILTNRLNHNLVALLPASVRANLNVGALTAGAGTLKQLPLNVQHDVILSLARAIHVVFLWAVPMAVLAFGVTWLLREVPLREHAHIGALEEAGEDLLVGLGQIEPEHAPDLVDDNPAV